MATTASTTAPDDPPPSFATADAARSRLADSLAGFVGWLQYPVFVFFTGDGVYCKFVAPALLSAFLVFFFLARIADCIVDLRERRTQGPTALTGYDGPIPYWQESKFLVGVAVVITLIVFGLFASAVAVHVSLNPLLMMLAATALRWISFAYGRCHRRQEVALQRSWQAAQIASWRSSPDPNLIQSMAPASASPEAISSPWWRSADTTGADAAHNESVRRR